MNCEERERLFRAYTDAGATYSKCTKDLSFATGRRASEYDVFLRAAEYARLIVTKTESAYKDHVCPQCLP